MYPHERSLVERLSDKPFILLGVNSDRTRDEFRNAYAREQMSWPSFFDAGGTSGPISTRWGVRATAKIRLTPFCRS